MWRLNPVPATRSETARPKWATAAVSGELPSAVVPKDEHVILLVAVTQLCPVIVAVVKPPATTTETSAKLDDPAPPVSAVQVMTPAADTADTLSVPPHVRGWMATESAFGIVNVRAPVGSVTASVVDVL